MGIAKLVIVDGAWGVGKSTTMQVLRLHLLECGHTVRAVWDEDKPHPLGFGPTIRDGRTSDRFVERWHELAADCARFEGATLVESGLLNGPVQELFETGCGAEAGELCRQVTEIVRPLDPLLIWLHRPDARAAWEAAVAVRGREWERFMTDHARTAAGAEIRTYYAGLCALFAETFVHCQLRRLAIDTTDENWDACYRPITDALGLPPIRLPMERLDDYLGGYRNPPGDRCDIGRRGLRLVVTGLVSEERPLLPNVFALDRPPLDNVRDRYYFPGMIVTEAHFLRDNSGRVDGMAVRSVHPSGSERAGEASPEAIWRRVS